MVAEDMNLLPPSKWDSLSLEDKEETFTLWKNKKEMARWEQHLQEVEMEKVQKRKNKFGKYGR